MERKKHCVNHTVARLPLLWLGPIFFSTTGEVRFETPSARAPQRDKVQAWLLAPKVPLRVRWRRQTFRLATSLQASCWPSEERSRKGRGKEREYSRPQPYSEAALHLVVHTHRPTSRTGNPNVRFSSASSVNKLQLKTCSVGPFPPSAVYLFKELLLLKPTYIF